MARWLGHSSRHAHTLHTDNHYCRAKQNSESRRPNAHQWLQGMPMYAVELHGFQYSVVEHHCAELQHRLEHRAKMRQCCCYTGRSPPQGTRRPTPPREGLHMFVAGLNFICTEKVSSCVYVLMCLTIQDDRRQGTFAHTSFALVNVPVGPKEAKL
jgi:hypothetical protein